MGEVKKNIWIKSYRKSVLTGILLTTFGASLILCQNNVEADVTSETANILTNDGSNKIDNNEMNNITTSTNTNEAENSETIITPETNENYKNDNVVSKPNNDKSVVEKNTNNQVSSVPILVKANEASLDNIAIDGTDLKVSGWHAVNTDTQLTNRFIIVYDVTKNKELVRNQITSTSRDDVKIQYPYLVDASYSGFSTKFKITDDMVGDQIQIVSRYTSTLDGSENYVDYWFTPVIFKRQEGLLESVKLIEGSASISVSGWHADDESVNKDFHFLILLDRTTGKQISQVSAKSIPRFDVKNVYPGIYNEVNSGFNGILSLNGVNFNHELVLVSRYSNNKTGNGGTGSYTDMWFNLPKYSSSNEASLDNFSFNGGTKLNVSGWHATNEAIGKENHFVILYDDSTKLEIARKKIDSSPRYDVATAYPELLNSYLSGFDASFDFNEKLIGHDLIVIDRYSTSSLGNGGTGKYVDYWFNAKRFGNSEYSIDKFVKNNPEGTSITISGWIVSNAAINKKYFSIIAIDKSTGLEITRQNVTLSERSDVKVAYKDFYNSKKSGFSTTLVNNNFVAGQQLQFIFRFSKTTTGNEEYSDTDSSNYRISDTNIGSFDHINVKSNTVYVDGWHAADSSYNKPYEYIIILDLNGKELTRVRVTSSVRNDVARNYPNVYNANNSGFYSTIALNTSINNRYVRFIHRYSNDPNGNGNYSDYYYGITGINITADVQKNAINAYIVNNNLRHANIQTSVWAGYPTDDMNYRSNHPEGVVIHETATYNDSIQGEINYAQNNWENAFVHSYVSDSQIINVANTDLKCWGSGPEGNARFVQFETIEVHSHFAFASELNNAAYYTAYLLRKYSLIPSVSSGNNGTIWSHHDVTKYLGGTDHTDPDGYWASNANQFFGTSYTMSDFGELVKYYYSNI